VRSSSSANCGHPRTHINSLPLPNHSKQITFENEECILDIFDTAGQEDFSVPQPHACAATCFLV
jgi:hypothetical protein